MARIAEYVDGYRGYILIPESRGELALLTTILRMYRYWWGECVQYRLSDGWKTLPVFHVLGDAEKWAKVINDFSDRVNIPAGQDLERKVINDALLELTKIT